MDCRLEKQCSALGGLFQSIVNDLKNSHPVWDDFAQKTMKLHLQLKAVISAVNVFLDALQKIADMATSAKGATRDIGTALTRICMRHRSIENRLKTLASSLIDCLVEPLTEKFDDWHKMAQQMDRDHAKDYKRSRHEIKKRSTDAARLQKKLRRGHGQGQAGVQRMLDSAANEVSDRYAGLLDAERTAVRQAMVEQRSQYCLFVSWFKPVMDGETALLSEIGQMTEVVDLLCKQSCDPYTLPSSSEQVICDVKMDNGASGSWNFQTPPGSPNGKSSSSLGSRQSSFCSLSSADSQKSAATVASTSGYPHQTIGQQLQHQTHTLSTSDKIDRVQNQPTSIGPRYSSLSSHDSGFTSQDTLFKRRHHSPLVDPSIGANFVQPPRFDSDDEAEHSTPGGLAAFLSEGGGQPRPSPSLTSVTWPTTGGGGVESLRVPPTDSTTMGPPRPHSISTAATAPKRQPIGCLTFVPPPRQNKFHVGSSNAEISADNVEVTPRAADFESTLCRAPPPPPPRGARTPMAAADFNESRGDQILTEIGPDQQAVYVNAAIFRHAHVQQKQPPPTTIRRPVSFVGGGVDGFLASLLSGGQSANNGEGSEGDKSKLKSTLSRDDDEDTLTDDCSEQLDVLNSDLDRFWCDSLCLSSGDSDFNSRCQFSGDLCRNLPAAKCCARNSQYFSSFNQSTDNQVIFVEPFDDYNAPLNCPQPICALKSYPSYCTLPRPLNKSAILQDQCSTSNANAENLHNFEGTPNQKNVFSNSSNCNTIVRRPAHLATNQGKAPPPPPLRRNSAITAATPSAPAVDLVRSTSRCATPVDQPGVMSNDADSLCSEPMRQRTAQLPPRHSSHQPQEHPVAQVCDLKLPQNRCTGRLRSVECRNKSLPRI